MPHILRRMWRYCHYGLPLAGVAFALWVVSEAVEGGDAEDWLGWTQWAAAGVAVVAAVFLVPIAAVFGALALAWFVLAVLTPIVGIPRRTRMWRGKRQHRADTDRKIKQVLDSVGIDTETALDRKPHEFSGGQAQRISIARALILEPKVIICDEPVSALDVSVRAQVINLLQDLQQATGVSFLFISHDLSVVEHISDRLIVMYLGRVVESGRSEDIWEHPAHPYTEALLAAAPIADPRTARSHTRSVLQGELPSPLNPPPGCSFNTRCPYVQDRCRVERPVLRDVSGGRKVACHYDLLEQPAALSRTAEAVN
ncbi:MAG: oligopeptide/dipeptide ABC transporter ATP-binding protein [Tardiphaga sp.]